MNRAAFLRLVGSAALGAAVGGRLGAAAALPEDDTLARTREVVAAATAFLSGLDPRARAAALRPFPAGDRAVPASFRGGGGGRMVFVGERWGEAVWSNFPDGDVPRPGLRLGDLTPAQHAAAMVLLERVLSAEGMAKVEAIMGSDQALAERGVPFAAGRDAYRLCLFGMPDATAPWLLQFGAHHLGLNVLFADGRAGTMPLLTGAQPAVYAAGGRPVRALAGESDGAFALLHALDAPQRRRAVLGDRKIDLSTGPGRDGHVPPLEGLPAAELDARQRRLLLDLVGQWIGILHGAYAARRMAEVEAGLADTHFVWRGPVDHAPGGNGAAYFRIQGPRLVIEFAPQDVGGDPAMHVHTVCRDPAGDYGRAPPRR